MPKVEIQPASKEIHDTLRISEFCFSFIGVSMTNDASKHLRGRFKSYLVRCTTCTGLFVMIVMQYSYVFNQMGISSSAIDGLIGSNLHIAGYGLMSQGKLLSMWYKQDKFRQLVRELAVIWPVDVKDDAVAAIKRDSLSSLRNSRIMYTFWNSFGVSLYSLTPIAEFLYFKARGAPAKLGYVYLLLYPFDKTKPIYHEFAFAFEMCGGMVSVFMMLGADLLFMTMTSHICMLLRLLQLKIRNLIHDDDIKRNTGTLDCYDNIVEVVKIHQRLIQFIDDLEEAFSAANLINVLLSSINICSCAFNVVFLDTWMAMSNKFFLGAALTQMGIVCWYADDIYRVSLGVSDAVYESGWYRTNVRSRRALLMMLQSRKTSTTEHRPPSWISMRRICHTYHAWHAGWRAQYGMLKHGKTLLPISRRFLLHPRVDLRAQYRMLIHGKTLLPIYWRYPLADSSCIYGQERSQKPLQFTALKFSAITMATFSSILTTSYSYFTLLHTSFQN